MFLSVVVPVYNVENYISECLNSLLDQVILKEDYEIICVNDGSTDKSGEIVAEYAMKYSNVILLEKENEGVSAARNLGMDNAAREYIWFVDSDDLVQSNILGEMKNRALQEKCDRLMFENVYEFVDDLTEKEKNLRKRKKLQANARYGDGVVWLCLKKGNFGSNGGAIQCQYPLLWGRCTF